MQLHELQPKHKNRSKKRVGRGGKKGTYSGKGLKGQQSRAGRKKVPIIRELIKRYPKLKGYRSFRMQKDYAVVNLDVLEKVSKVGDVVNSENLLKKGLVSKINGKAPNIKILGKGKITKSITVEGCKISESAKTAIEKAGGKII